MQGYLAQYPPPAPYGYGGSYGPGSFDGQIHYSPGLVGYPGSFGSWLGGHQYGYVSYAPPAYTPVPGAPAGVSGGFNTYRPVPAIGNDATSLADASQAIRSRLFGSPEAQARIHLNGQSPHTPDAYTHERLGVWLALQADDRLRYDADTGRLFLTRPDGSMQTIMGRDQIAALHASSGNHQVFQQLIQQSAMGGAPPFGSPPGVPPIPQPAPLWGLPTIPCSDPPHCRTSTACRSRTS